MGPQKTSCHAVGYAGNPVARSVGRWNGGDSGCAFKDRCDKLLEIIGAAPIVRGCQPAATDGQDPKNRKRREHRPARFVDVNLMLVVPRAAIKGEEQKTEHVKRS